MNLNRGLIKQQAKQLIQNNVLKLFVISFVVSLCLSAISGGIRITIDINKIINGDSIFSVFQDNFDNYLDDYLDDYDFDDDFNNYGYGDKFEEFGKDFNNFGNEYEIEEFDDEYNDFYNFGYEEDNPPPDYSIPNQNSYNNLGGLLFLSGIMSMLSFAASVAQILLAPLSIGLAGYYVSFIRGRKADIGDGINTVFREAFKNNYGKKVALCFLRGLFTGLLCLLFIVPGIIYFYSTYFAYQIMADNPEISPMQALRLSKKMVSGNRTELFVLNLSFIPWGLLCIFVFPLIYVIPYVETTNALYYENFRIRALQQGRVTEDDFLSDQQRYNKYANIYANPNNAGNGNNYQQNGYQPYNQPNNQQNAYYNAQQSGQYYQQPNGYNQPQQPSYTPPQQPQQTQAEYTPDATVEETIKQAEPESETKLYTDED